MFWSLMLWLCLCCFLTLWYSVLSYHIRCSWLPILLGIVLVIFYVVGLIGCLQFLLMLSDGSIFSN